MRAQGRAAKRHNAIAVAGISGERRFHWSGEEHAPRLCRTDPPHRKRIRRFPAVGADRSPHARHLPKVARSLRRKLGAPSSRLCLDGARADPFLGPRPWPRAGKSMRARRTPLSRLAARHRLDCGRRSAVPERAPAHLHLPLILALWTGQRQGDLLRLPWSAYNGTHIRLRQGKTGERVVIPIGAPLKTALDATPKLSPIILVKRDGKPWTSAGFQTAWSRACKAVGLVGLTFHDLRGTAVTRLAIAGATEAEIATITGHSLRSVRAIRLGRGCSARILLCAPSLSLPRGRGRETHRVRREGEESAQSAGRKYVGEPNGGSRVVRGEESTGPRPMLKAPMLLAAVLVVCAASNADARRRHHGYYGGYGERGQSSFDDWRRARDAQGQGQDRGQGSGQDQAQGQAQDQRQDQNQGQHQDRVQDRSSDRARERGDRRRVRSLDEWRRSRDTQNLGQDLGRDRGEDRSRETYDRRRARYEERRARYDDWRRSRGREREDGTRRREAERGDAALRRTRGGPFGAVVEKLVRGCGQQGAEFENWPFDAIAQIVGADEKERTALEGLRDNANKAAERLAADCPQDVPAAPAARLEAVEQGIDAALAAFDTVEPALATFYGTLDDEQKTRLYRDMAAPVASNAPQGAERREAQEERRERRDYSSRRDRARAYAAAREPTPSQARSQAAAPPWSGAMCEELAAVLRGWPVREIERDVRLSSPQRVAFYELVTASLKAADTLGGACPAETALTPVGRMDAVRKRLAAVRAATAAIRPALVHFYEALDQGQKVRFAGMS